MIERGAHLQIGGHHGVRQGIGRPVARLSEHTGSVEDAYVRECEQLAILRRGRRKIDQTGGR